MRHANAGTGALLLLTLMLLAGCGGAKSESAARREYVRVNIHEDATARAINASGEIVLTVPAVAPIENYRPSVVLWKDGALNDIGQAFGDTSVAADINDSGQVVISAYQFETATRRSVVYADGVITEILVPVPEVKEIIPVSLSNDGTVLGYCILKTAPPPSSIWELPKPFLWRNGTVTMIDGGSVMSLNEQGKYLVMLGQLVIDGLPWGSEWGVGQPDGSVVPMSEIGPNAYTFSPRAINDNGVLVGSFKQEAFGPSRPGVIRNGQIQPILPNAQAGTAIGVNNRGDIIGWTKSGPFLVRSTGTVLNLGDLFPEVRDKEAIQLVGINDDGQIIGTISKQAFVLKPRALAP